MSFSVERVEDEDGEYQILEGDTMNEIEIVKMLMKAKSLSGAKLAKKLGYNTASAVMNRLQSKTMTVEMLVKLLTAMDCELIIRNTVGEKESFIVKNENRNEVKIYNTRRKMGNE
jgi:antitoxin component HigA of HigAB toxin-antitoxin module